MLGAALNALVVVVRGLYKEFERCEPLIPFQPDRDRLNPGELEPPPVVITRIVRNANRFGPYGGVATPSTAASSAALAKDYVVTRILQQNSARSGLPLSRS